VQFELKNYSNECIIETPIGKITISVLKGKVEQISFSDFSSNFDEFSISLPMMRKVVKQLKEYFNKKRKKFDLALDFSKATEFQRSVWRTTMQIPYGEVRTYAQIAKNIGKPLAYRAVANALASNPFVLVVPCHRVVSKNGIGGFSAGVWRKKWLLNFEKMEEDIL